MYDELVKRVRQVAEEVSEDYDVDPYNAEQRCFVIEEAAAAIEELQEDNAALNGTVSNLIGQIAESCKPRWIPVTERLPEHLTSVIVHRKDGGIFEWQYFNTSPTDECWIDDRMNVYSFYDVTHWMPLPQPPEEEWAWKKKSKS